MSFGFMGAGPRSTVITQVKANASPHDGHLADATRVLVTDFLTSLGDDHHSYVVKGSEHSYGDGTVNLELSVQSFGKLPEEISEADVPGQGTFGPEDREAEIAALEKRLEFLRGAGKAAPEEQAEPGWASGYPLS